eukprot:3002201-Amphidinium_carterae.2
MSKRYRRLRNTTGMSTLTRSAEISTHSKESTWERKGKYNEGEGQQNCNYGVYTTATPSSSPTTKGSTQDVKRERAHQVRGNGKGKTIHTRGGSNPTATPMANQVQRILQQRKRKSKGKSKVHHYHHNNQSHSTNLKRKAKDNKRLQTNNTMLPMRTISPRFSELLVEKTNIQYGPTRTDNTTDTIISCKHISKQLPKTVGDKLLGTNHTTELIQCNMKTCS